MSTAAPEMISESKLFGGHTRTYRHESEACGCAMRFTLYLPSGADERPVPVLYWLSGLTCTEENFTIKAGAQRYAAELGIALVAPDTSPRGLGLPGEDEDWDLPYACRQGQCLSCGGKVQDGDAHDFVRHSNNETLGDDEVEKGYILTCTAYPTDDFALETNETP